MSSRKDPLENDCYYHVLNRGVNSEKITKTSEDAWRFMGAFEYYRFVDTPFSYKFFLDLSPVQQGIIMQQMKKDDRRYIDIITFNWMPNHFHFLLKQNIDGGITKFIHHLSTSYSKYFNARYRRTGSLFGSRFKSVKIENEEQLLHVNRYIHLNTYSAGITKSFNELIQYPFSSLREYLGLDKTNIYQKDDILYAFKDRDLYSKFLENRAEYQRSLEVIKKYILE